MFDGRYPVRVSGPLAAYVAGFRVELVGLGYMPRVAQDHAYVLAHLSRWMDAEGIASAMLSMPQVERFVQARHVAGYRHGVTVRSLRLLLKYLRDRDIIPAPHRLETVCPVELVLKAYREYLDQERRLSERTAGQRVYVARRFLLTQTAEGRLRLDQLVPEAVIGFITSETSRYAANSMKMMTTGLRSLLRYLFVTGGIDRDLASAVPSVAGWQQRPLPSTLDADVVTALLDSCDRTTTVGRRDFAVLTLMARLGLRAHEVSALRLDDIEWRTGELVVHGKGGRVDRLPLPADVGKALADYLQYARRPSAFREVFLRSCGPDAPMARQSVVMASQCAARRAGRCWLRAEHWRRSRNCCVITAK